MAAYDSMLFLLQYLFSEMLHVHVGSFTPFGGSYMPDSGGYQHQGRFPVGEVAYDLCPSTDLSVQSFQRIVGSEPLPVFRGKMEVAQGLLVAFLDDLGGLLLVPSLSERHCRRCGRSELYNVARELQER